MSATKERLPYIDVAKGLLILMVVWGHFELILRETHKTSDPVVAYWDHVEIIWSAFFMPAFFFITGLCGNFNKPFKKFVIQSFRTTLLPALIICVSITLVKYLTWAPSFIWIVKTMVKDVGFRLTGEWFIPTLFLCRIGVWALAKVRRLWLRLFVSLMSFCLGLYLYNEQPGLPDVWYFKHSLMAMVFMVLGNVLSARRIKDGVYFLSLCLYLVVIMSLIALDAHVPYFTNRIEIGFYEISLSLMISISGILGIFWISRKIGSNPLLEYLGRNSLVIYLLHFTLYEILMGVVIEHFNVSPIYFINPCRGNIRRDHRYCVSLRSSAEHQVYEMGSWQGLFECQTSYGVRIMIPKVIHYCWFGQKPIPKQYQKYMDSWGRFMPGYEVKRWDESNYDVHCVPFSSEAYDAGKYAYVSDYARLKILYEHGGVYFDTDVEVIKPIDDILAKGAFMAFEKNTAATDGGLLNVAVGLGFAVEPGNQIIREALDYYESHHYIYPDGRMEQVTIVRIVTDILKRHGLASSDRPVEVEGITIYPWDYFCPVEFLSSKLEITENTRTIHHYTATWMSRTDRLKMLKGYYANKVRKLLGIKRK